MNIKNTILVDLDRKNTVGYAIAVAGDSGTRSVVLKLRANFSPWTIPEGVTASLVYKKTDGTSGWYDTMPDGSAAYSIAGETITMKLAPQVLSVPGPVSAAVVLRDAEGNRLTTFDFCIDVESSPADAETSEDYYNLKVVTTVENLEQQVKALSGEVEELKKGGGGGGSIIVDEDGFLTTTSGGFEIDGDGYIVM